LILIRPEIETLLLEVPSPPIHKMYGAVLKSFAGEESPMKAALQKGAEIRNKLIHRPTEPSVDGDDADLYVLQVEVAISHLMILLRPTDEYLRRIHKDRVFDEARHRERLATQRKQKPA